MPSQRLAVFYHGEDKILRYKIKDGDQWEDGHGLEGHGCWRRPSAVNYRGATYVFCQGAEGGNLWCSILRDGHCETAQVPGVSMSQFAGPCAVVRDDCIWLFYRSSSDDGSLWYGIFKDNRWLDRFAPVPKMSLQAGPSAILWNDYIHVFHRGGGNTDRSLWCNVLSGSNWEGDRQFSEATLFRSPGAVVYKDLPWVFHHDRHDRGGLFYVRMGRIDHIWTEDRQVPDAVISESPSPLVVGDDLLVFYQGGYMNGELWYTKVNGQVSHTRVPGVAMQCSPCPHLLPG